MVARAIWKGVIRFDKFQLPVKLYSAVEDQRIHFHLLHDQDMVRLKQRMVNPETDETVAHGEMQRGYEIDRGVLVVFDEDELESLEPQSTRDIEIIQFIDPDAINHQWYDRAYWLGPDGGSERYFTLATALAKREVEGVARWVMRNKQYLGVLRAEQGYLALVTLRHVEEIISADQLEAPEGRRLEKQEHELAGKLIAALEADFDPDDYHDDYREQLQQLIEAKREGGTIEVEEYVPVPPRESLAEALKASLEGVK